MLAGHWKNYISQNLNAGEAHSCSIAWLKLAENAMQPAGFNAPEWVLPILKRAEAVELATISQGPDLLMALPLQDKRSHRVSWVNPLNASGLPHVSETLAESVLLAFMQAQTKPILLRSIPADGPFIAALQKQSTHFEVIERWQRAALKPVGNFENWLQSNFDQKRRKEMKRLRNRLGEQGALTTEALLAGGDPKSFVADFLALEAAGWKGKKGTAINAMPQLSESFYEAVSNLHKSGKLRFWNLKLNGKAIASLFAIVEGSHAWLGKIAYDEAFAKYSPGVLIILDCTESFFAEPKITQIDSSAIPDHPMIDRIWRDRLPMVSVLVAPASVSSRRFKFVISIEKLRRRARSFVRDLYYKLKGARRT